ncbi:hypothetical protein Tdes44962_MAKER02791 [Teratosphaeria destructans]|uniref:Uncharacterized protein n=1 Tax=Teratosphaeria destructans TaxID=418781 RepID=A0A9W7SSH6_9PEZI|nr:hypothetical protein Tdes44962_MAKER02791 [Teratosphaeria destructans]
MFSESGNETDEGEEAGADGLDLGGGTRVDGGGRGGLGGRCGGGAGGEDGGAVAGDGVRGGWPGRAR